MASNYNSPGVVVDVIATTATTAGAVTSQGAALKGVALNTAAVGERVLIATYGVFNFSDAGTVGSVYTVSSVNYGVSLGEGRVLIFV